jgi:hypothetical protein
MNADFQDFKKQRQRILWDKDELSAAAPQPKKFYWTQMNTDKHRKGFMKNA